MKWRNSTTHYGALPAALHWLMLLLLVAVFASMELRGYFPKGSVTREAMKSWHYTLGLSVLGLALLRLAVSFTAKAPAIAPPPARTVLVTARLMKIALYGFMLGMPLLGWAIRSAAGADIVFFGLRLPPLIGASESLAHLLKELHEAGATIGYVLIGLHAAAALYHHYVVRDDTLRRMLPR
ncbi:cytochrome b [Massilia sp. DWR3-1-1]|uniref:cytochrome b n=1 Tax=Massilia sp. DWR3-1-1 TaxID=2804559 RepID=UPI003CEC2E7E